MKSFLAFALLTVGVAVFAGDEKPERDVVDQLVQGLKKRSDADFSAAYSKLESQLRKKEERADQLAQELLQKKAEIVSSPEVQQLLDAMVTEKKSVLAAQLLLKTALAKNKALYFPNPRVVVGQLKIDDRKIEPDLVMAQMEILDEGYFAAEVGDFMHPLCFRAPGYQDLDVPLKAKDGDVVHLGQVTLKPLSADQHAAIKGKVALDGSTDFKSVFLVLTIPMGPLNTPNNGYSPRPRWPEPTVVPVSETGEFLIEGLNPSDYDVQAMTQGHISVFKRLQLKPGEQFDVGTLRLLNANLEFYVGKPAPKTEPLAWEKDFATALKRAQEEKKPLFVMMSATWCGPCKMLESSTLTDPWTRYFLSNFIVVKAYEDKEVEAKYELKGYPTIVFANSAGDPVYKSMGYKPAIDFAAECAKAFKALSIETPPELQTLTEKKVISIE